ncbi:hypothetical protein AB6Q85_002332 [Vibrio cholerae]
MLVMKEIKKEVATPLALNQPPGMKSLKVIVNQELPLGITNSNVVSTKHQIAVLENVSIEDALVSKLHHEVVDLHKDIQSIHTCVELDKEAANDSVVKTLKAEV